MLVYLCWRKAPCCTHCSVFSCTDLLSIHNFLCLCRLIWNQRGRCTWLLICRDPPLKVKTPQHSVLLMKRTHQKTHGHTQACSLRTLCAGSKCIIDMYEKTQQNKLWDKIICYDFLPNSCPFTHPTQYEKLIITWSRVCGHLTKIGLTFTPLLVLAWLLLFSKSVCFFSC